MASRSNAELRPVGLRPVGLGPVGLGETLFALADPTRRALLHRLSSGEARVTDLAESFDISLNSVSKHLRMLERARLVTRRRAGREHLLSLNAEPLDQVADWIGAQRTEWLARLAALDRLLVKQGRKR